MELESQISAQTGNFLTNMDKASLFIMIIGVAFWAVVALGATAGAVGVYIAISKVSGRWEHVKQMFSQGTKERILTVSLVLAMTLMVVIMIRSALMG